jgi:hypothetical protein
MSLFGGSVDYVVGVIGCMVGCLTRNYSVIEIGDKWGCWGCYNSFFCYNQSIVTFGTLTFEIVTDCHI